MLLYYHNNIMLTQLTVYLFILVATALCNTVISNLAGIFITPALLLQFFGKSIELPFLDLVKKLCSKVLLPVAVGQALRATPFKDFYSKQTAFFKRFQEVGTFDDAHVNTFLRVILHTWLNATGRSAWNCLECF